MSTSTISRASCQSAAAGGAAGAVDAVPTADLPASRIMPNCGVVVVNG